MSCLKVDKVSADLIFCGRWFQSLSPSNVILVQPNEVWNSLHYFNLQFFLSSKFIVADDMLQP